VEGSAVRPSALPNSPSKTSTPKQKCHPDRSAAKWRDLQCACRRSRILRLKPQPPKQKCHPDRSEAQWRDLLFIIPISTLKGSATLPFVIPTEVEGSAVLRTLLGNVFDRPERSAVSHQKINLQTQKRPAASRALLLACFC
jgi:hypothetical protein